MKLSDFCIKRPVFATVINLLIILVGVVSYQSLTIREFPKVDEPVVSVTTSYFGASSEIIESQITKPLEDVLSGLEGVDIMTSESKDEQSAITLRFVETRDIESATNDVRDRVSKAIGLLPKEAEAPQIAKSDADNNAMMWISVTSDTHSLMEISEYVDTVLKDKVEMVPGVASLFIVGNRMPSMRISLNSLKLSGYDLSVHDVIEAVRHQNVELPSGRIESELVEFTVFAKTDLATVEEFGNLIIKQEADNLVRLKDVARINIEPAYERFLARYNTRPTVAIGVIKQSTANPLDISKEIYKLEPIVQATLPEGMSFDVAYDTTVVIKKSIHSVFKTLVEAVLLVVLVIFFFLRSIRATLIPIVTIPVSLIGAFAIMAAFGFTINTLTLLAMVLAIGLVVDDAIVVLENIFRHIEDGMKPMDAAFKGMKEIGTAVVAMTLTLLAVFAPVAFSTGTIGKLFSEFAIVLAGSVLISGITALTLSPMMCSRLLKHEEGHGKFYWAVENFLSWLSEKYKSGLAWCLNHAKIILVAFVVILGLNYVIFNSLKSELTPPEDRGFVLTMGLAPEGSTLAYTDTYAKQIEQILSANPDVRSFFTVVGWPYVKQTISFGILPPYKERDKSQFQIVNELMGGLWGVPGVQAFAINAPSSIGGGGLKGNVGFVIQSPKGFDHLKEINDKVLAKVRENPKLVNVQTDLIMNKPQVELTVNRERAAALGVEIDHIGQTLYALYDGIKASKYKSGSQQYDVIVKSERSLTQTPSSIDNVYVRNNKGVMIPLSSLVDEHQTIVPSSLNHFNKLPALILSASVSQDSSLQEALDYLDKMVQEIEPGTLTDYVGESRTFKQTGTTMALTFILALIVIFLVLSAQFESFKNPFIILLSVPCAILGALLVLKFTGGSLNIFSQIGLITLIGLITKHGILIVEFTNQLIEEGKELSAALIEAASLRFRPILMTTCATILGATPLALATGAGSEGRGQIGWAIVGGMFIGTIFTIFMVPVIYKVANAWKKSPSIHAQTATS